MVTSSFIGVNITELGVKLIKLGVYFKCTSNNTKPLERKDDQLKKRSKHVKFKNNIFLK